MNPEKNSSSLISHNRYELLFFFVAGSMAKNLDNFTSEKNSPRYKLYVLKREHVQETEGV
jgi:hypothetical protein